MKYYLCSSLVDYSKMELHNEYHWVENLLKHLHFPCHALLVASSPDEIEKTRRYAQEIVDVMEKYGLSLSGFDILDRNSARCTKELIDKANMIVAMGGHVPTQNSFFQEIDLKKHLQEFRGIWIGSSAGSMNSATLVYAQPELEGEVIDSTYQRFVPGLGLTEKMILPHYSSWKNEVVDGYRLLEDITYPDSQGHTFYLMEDGSYVLGDTEEKIEEVIGNYYVLRDGVIVQ
ncbi:Type 1 glutamine amidotransferase-like domain-containing protein [uncultured Solobacterium sp.]|jgi:hypothetical protein|uniref:Type 1 glutamine amidotransferase-like domain-containing protein n=1 Tax=uncultured Solobacterium sp. TaxID=747375 RepID=UPI0026127991|nr:Type 1 glutamine amidotransferase-like domain-containing protein [uncultured Solobacterium sp.]